MKFIMFFQKVGVYRGDFKASMFKDENLIEEIKSLIIHSAAHTWEIKVVCLDGDENIIRIYNSLTEASKDGFSISKISAVLSGNRKTTGGYGWKKYSDLYKDSKEKIDKYFEILDNGKLPDLVFPTKKVICCDLNGNIEAIYNTIKEAERNDGYDSRQISAVLVGKQKTSREHLWYRYSDYPDKEKLEEFEKSSKHKKSTPIKIDYSIIKFTSDLSYKKSYSSLKEAAEDIGVERRTLRLSIKDSLLEFDGYYYMRKSEFCKLYE